MRTTTFITHNPAATARQLRTPAVLILTGANDQQADPKQVPDWAEAFKAAGNTDVTGQMDFTAVCPAGRRAALTVS